MHLPLALHVWGGELVLFCQQETQPGGQDFPRLGQEGSVRCVLEMHWMMEAAHRPQGVWEMEAP